MISYLYLFENISSTEYCLHGLVATILPISIAINKNEYKIEVLHIDNNRRISMSLYVELNRVFVFVD